MIKDIYLHTSSLKYIGDLKDDDSFESTYHYDPWDTAKAFQNEYGRIKTSQNYYHILVGKIRQNECPWCGSTPSLKKVESLSKLRLEQWFMACEKCGSKGPVLNVNKDRVTNEMTKDHTEYFVECRYSERIAWDYNLLKDKYE